MASSAEQEDVCAALFTVHAAGPEMKSHEERKKNCAAKGWVWKHSLSDSAGTSSRQNTP